ncbi:MAG: hypothetical protein AB7F59_10075 [Bdellovibrionales bacterium]
MMILKNIAILGYSLLLISCGGGFTSGNRTSTLSLPSQKSTTCGSGLTEHNGTCHAKTRSCFITNGTGVETFSGGSYGACVASSCNANFTLHGNVCHANTQDCSISNGSGVQTFSGGSYGVCAASSCNANFTLHGNACHANTQVCSISNGSGVQTFSGGSYGACVASSCSSGFTLHANTCHINTQSCSISNGSGVQTFSGGSYGACVASSCNANFTLHANACHANTQVCSIANGSGVQTFSGGSYGACVASSCNVNFKLANSVCVPEFAVASDSAIKVMQVAYPAYAYAFSATYIGPNQYVSIFDAEGASGAVGQPDYAPAGSMGDSAGAKYGSAYNFGTHSFNQDLLITRSPAAHVTSYHPQTGAALGWDGPSAYMNGGASNPMLIEINGNWAMYWIAVAKDANGGLHNQIMMSWFGTGDSSISNIFGALMRTFQVDGSFGLSWGLHKQSVANTAGPVIAEETNDRLWTEYAPQEGENGLIGQLTTGPDGTVYYYYDDYDYETSKWYLYRRTVRPWLTSMSTPVIIAEQASVIAVNYHVDLKRFVVLQYCNNNAHYEVCVKTFTDANLTGLVSNVNDYQTYGIDIWNDSAMPKWLVSGSTNNVIIQPGIRKNGKGQHFTDSDGQMIVYLPVSKSPVPWDVQGVYAKRVHLN